MIRFAWYRSGALFGIRYDFARGDALPWHSHHAEEAHNLIVLDGAVRLIMLDSQRLALAGDVIDFDNALRHTISCETATAKTLNLFLNGIPAGYAALPSTEHSGVIGVQLGDTN
jgi:quercetin dioxygenase-like cupin family protein